MSKKIIPLNIQLNATQWPAYAKRMDDKAFKETKKQVHQRDSFSCCYCEFQSTHAMDVINLDGNYKNNNLSNLATACPLCAQCLFLHMVGKAEIGGGKLIYLPNMTQNQLNALCHVLFSAIVNGTNYTQDAQNTLNQLRLRSNKVDATLGKGMSEPAMLGQMLLDTPIKNAVAIQNATLKDLRILPSKNKFESLIGQWSREALRANAGSKEQI